MTSELPEPQLRPPPRLSVVPAEAVAVLEPHGPPHWPRGLKAWGCGEVSPRKGAELNARFSTVSPQSKVTGDTTPVLGKRTSKALYSPCGPGKLLPPPSLGFPVLNEGWVESVSKGCALVRESLSTEAALRRERQISDSLGSQVSPGEQG